MLGVLKYSQEWICCCENIHLEIEEKENGMERNRGIDRAYLFVFFFVHVEYAHINLQFSIIIIDHPAGNFSLSVLFPVSSSFFLRRSGEQSEETRFICKKMLRKIP